jgi:hypothetical protein
MPHKLLRVRTAAVAGLAALSLGGVAVAATGGLAPAAAERAPKAPPSTTGGQASAHGAAAILVHGKDAAGPAGGSTAKSSDHATGPDASGPARHGLCRAWLAGQGDANGQRADAPPFQALVAAAGGADRVAAYCQADAATPAAHSQQPAAPSGNGQEKPAPPTTGPPTSPGNGHGQGGPPATG